MRIGDLARSTGVSVRSLRYYEQQGLLSSRRTSGGQREYPESAVDRVIRIQEMFAAGLSSRTMADLLPCVDDVDGSPSAAATPQLVGLLVEERTRIDESIKDLQRARDVLDGVICAAGGDDAEHWEP